jgi:hypothetical protein
MRTPRHSLLWLGRSTVPAVGARKLRDNEDLFCANDYVPEPERIIINVAKVIDCVEPRKAVVGHQDLAGQGPEA